MRKGHDDNCVAHVCGQRTADNAMSLRSLDSGLVRAGGEGGVVGHGHSPADDKIQRQQQQQQQLQLIDTGRRTQPDDAASAKNINNPISFRSFLGRIACNAWMRPVATHTARGVVYVCLCAGLDTSESCKTAEPIEMLVGGTETAEQTATG